jgi:hypothetical protein
MNTSLNFPDQSQDRGMYVVGESRSQHKSAC